MKKLNAGQLGEGESKVEPHYVQSFLVLMLLGLAL